MTVRPSRYAPNSSDNSCAGNRHEQEHLAKAALDPAGIQDCISKCPDSVKLPIFSKGGGQTNGNYLCIRYVCLAYLKIEPPNIAVVQIVPSVGGCYSCASRKRCSCGTARFTPRPFAMGLVATGRRRIARSSQGTYSLQNPYLKSQREKLQ